ncbi:MAG: hypothetical protein IH899_07455, partial [Planctomycetes bacterium]|nr:hypothetical protein [Planctomycetota bacterium]
MRESGQLDALLSSCARFSEHAAVISAARENSVTPQATVHIGPPLVFERIWQQLGLPKVLKRLLQDRKFEFPVERAIFMTVLHRRPPCRAVPGRRQRPGGRALVPALCHRRNRRLGSAPYLSCHGLARRVAAARESGRSR